LLEKFSKYLLLQKIETLGLTAGYGWAQYNLIAGWSSLVARRVHIPKAGGSNPPPATFLIDIKYMNKFRLIIACILLMFARLLKILTIAASPKEHKENFRDMI
tara:strand:+ start:1352 stop:1660 length:309 start_codon:yes stop_codon:yes gene_type:complete